MFISGEFKSKVLAQQWVGGTFVNLGSSVTAEIAGNSGFDWVLIDHEHGPAGEDTMLHQLQAVGGTPAVPIVRIAINELARYKRVLDMGAHGVMVPFVNTVEEAKAAAAAVQYPPHGNRGIAKFNRGAQFGVTFADYFKHAREWVVLMAQIETPEAAERAEAIAGVDGVDVLFVGPTDLSYNMGIPDQLDSPKFKDTLAKIATGARKAGKAAGILVHTAAMVPMVKELGYTVVALGSDGGSVATGLRANAAALNAAREKK